MTALQNAYAGIYHPRLGLFIWGLGGEVTYLQTNETLTFAAFSDTSSPRTTPILSINISIGRVIVSWGEDQVNTGVLLYGDDYTIAEGNKVKLTQPKWTSTIDSNSLGLLNVNVYEAAL